MKRWGLALSLVVHLAGGVGADPLLESDAWKIRQGSRVPARQAEPGTDFPRAFLAFSLAESLSRNPGSAVNVERLVAPYLGWLKDFPEIREVHGHREPAWIRGEAEQVALVTLALIELDRLAPNATRREQIQQFAQGISLLRQPQANHYPFGAHTSFDSSHAESRGYAPLLDRQGETVGRAPGAIWRPSRSYQVRALVAAADYLGDRNLLEQAQHEALGIWSHLVTSRRWVWGFVPRPTGKEAILGSAAAVDNFLALHQSTRQTVYLLLASLAGQDGLEATPESELQGQAQEWLRQRLKDSSLGRWAGFRDLGEAVSYQVMEAEDGRAVQKAFDVLPVEYPNGESGKMVRVGRDQMFWMRFDLEREGDYFFYLIFLKSRLEGGLVSVLMRIDGDKIFQVNLGGASDPYVDMDLVDGPRTLRAGPHSFGIRFAGLLMTQPAVLDSVLAWPAVERRFLGTADGRRLLLLHNMSPRPARALYTELPSWPPRSLGAVDRNGQSVELTRESDRRRRKEYLVVPAGGVAWLEWQESARNVEE